MNRWTGLIACACVLACFGGCAGTTPPASDDRSRVRCVDSQEPGDPRDSRIQGTRPMFFFFCIQNL